MAASAPPAGGGTVDAQQLARLPFASIIAHESGTQATRVEASGETLLLRAQSPGTTTPVVFLLVGGAFSYPLVAGSGCMLDGNRLLFPTGGAGELTLILQPSEVEEDVWGGFVDALSTVTELRAAPGAVVPAGSTDLAEGKEGWGDKVAGGVKYAGAAAAIGLVKGATFAGYGIKRVGAFAKSRLKKGDTEVEVSEETKESLEKAKVISQAAMHVTGGLIEGVTNVAMTLGGAMAGAMKDTDVGKRISAGASSETGQELRKVAGAGVHAFANVWNALEVSARTVGKATADATADVVEHKYGSQAADATKQGFSAAGCAALSVFHVTNLAGTSVAAYTTSHGDKEQLVTRRQLQAAQEATQPGPSGAKALEDGH